MDLQDQPYFAMLRSRLEHLGQRQKLLSENIANASTPGFRPRDVDMGAFEKLAQAEIDKAPGAKSGQFDMSATHNRHLTAGGRLGGLTRGSDQEVTMDGNQVVLEDQMVRAAETRASYELSLTLYQKGLQLLRLAARPPGR